MTIQVRVNLPDTIYRQIEQEAEARKQGISELLADTIRQAFAPMPINPEREAMLQEQKAYEAMHTELVGQYEGQYVAIYQGQLIDHDPDIIALAQRRQQNYPNQTVMITKVEKEPQRILHIRSPRLIREDQ